MALEPCLILLVNPIYTLRFSVEGLEVERSVYLESL